MSDPMEEKTYPVKHSAAFAGSTLVTMGLVDLLAHLGPTGLLVGGLASYVAWKHGPEIYTYVREKLPSQTPPEPSEAAEQQSHKRGRSMMDRALGRFPDELETGDQVQDEVEPEMEQANLFVKRQQQQEEHALRRLTIEEICEHVKRNSYKIFIGRSLTSATHHAVQISIDKRHFKFIGASQKGKSSMAAAFLEIITRTHDPEHVMLALLDLEDQTSKLLADKPHIAELLIDDKLLLLHARTREQVVEYLNHIVALMDYRYSLSKHEVIDGPILLVYIEEFLALKKYLRKKIDAALDKEVERKAKKMYADFTYAVSEIASRGLKVRIQLLLCAQVDYRDEDKELQEALINVDAGMSFCVRPTAAQAAGFSHNELLNRNYQEDKVGQAVVEMSDCKDLVLAPEFDLEQKILDLEDIYDIPHSPAQRVSERKNAPVKPVNVNTVKDVNEPAKRSEDTVNGREYSLEPVNVSPTFTPAEETQVLLAYAEILKVGKPVTRTGIRDSLGWNNKQYERVIKPVCDKYQIS
jgi:hypothetical protein